MIWTRTMFKPVSWIRIGFNMDPDPAVYLNADPDLQIFDDQTFYNFTVQNNHISFV